MEKLSRRKFLLGVGAAVAAPAIVRVASIMPVRVTLEETRFVYMPPMTAYEVLVRQREHYAKMYKELEKYIMPPLLETRVTLLAEGYAGTYQGVVIIDEPKLDLRPGAINVVPTRIKRTTG